MILASSLLCSSRSSGVSSVGDQEEGLTKLVGTLTLTIVRDNDHNLRSIHINCCLNCRSQFTIGGRKEMMHRFDDWELGMGTSESLTLEDR